MKRNILIIKSPNIGWIFTLLFLSININAQPLLSVEINPNPVQANELLDVQITISNPTNSITGLLSMQVLWPENLGPRPVFTGGGICGVNFDCQPGEYLFWSTSDLGNLPQGENFTVSFSVSVLSGVVNGTIIPIEVELFEDGVSARTLSHSVTVQSNSPLELTIDPMSDPVVPGEVLTYELTYSNTGNNLSSNTVLTFPLPTGASFVSATGNGTESGGIVSWNIGDLNVFSDKHERVEVLINGILANGNVLLIDSAVISGTVAFVSQQAKAMAVSNIHSNKPLKLDVEINPDPVQSNELLDVQITMSNPTTSITGLLSLQVLWPENLDPRPVFTGGGICGVNFDCQPGEYLFWSTSDLGILPQGENFTVSFSVSVLSGVVSGTIIPFEVELFEDGVLARTISHSVTVQSNSPLELTIDPLIDPVVPGEVLTYELTYSNTSNNLSLNSVLTFPLPIGTSFVTATGNGIESGGIVSWNIGNLNVFSDKHERVEVLVGSGLANGEILLINQALISGTISFIPQQARAMAVSKVHSNKPLKLDVEINPDPIQPNELLDAQITVSNPTNSATGLLSVQVLWPENIGFRPVMTGGADCGGTIDCQPGEYMFWSTSDLGNLPPGENFTVSFNETVMSGVANGTIIPFEIELFEDGVLARTISHSVTVQSNSPLELVIDPLSDPVIPGETLVYEITYSNVGSNLATNTILTFPLPVGASFVSATGNGIESGGIVSWNIGDLNAFVDQHERVELLIGGGLSNGEVLLINAAEISGIISFLNHKTRAMAVSKVHANKTLKLLVEINPNPILSNELIDVQIGISNPTGGFTGDLSMRLLWPEHINNRPIMTRGADCGGSTVCNAGDYMFWSTADLGSLPPGENFTVSFTETVLSGVASGTIIPFEIELFEGGAPIRTISHSITVQSNSPLELTIDPQTDPVIPGDMLIYDLAYGNTGSDIVANTMLTFPIPSGSSFVSATGNGVESGNIVSWNVGNITGLDAFEEAVTVLVNNGLANGNILNVDSAKIEGTILQQTSKATAMALSHVHASKPITLDLNIGPSPIQPSELLSSQIMINNPTGSFTGDLSLRVLWPEHMDSFPLIGGGALCGGNTSCDPGEYMFWSTTNLGSLSPGGNFVVTFSETIRSNVLDGTVIPFEVELFEGLTLIRSISHSILVVPPNAPPIAIDDSILVNQGTTITTLVGGNTSVLDNDTDADDINLTASIISTTTNGALTLNSNGTFSYTHDGSVNLTDGFDYQVCDDEMPTPACDTGHVSIVIVISPEIDIQGNGLSIIDGDITPNVGDDTEFGIQLIGLGSVNHTFVISNLGMAQLNLTGNPIVSLTGNSDFGVTTQPSSSIVMGGTSNFTIAFNPTSEAIITATVSISNNDIDEDPYTFQIQGRGVVSEDIFSDGFE